VEELRVTDEFIAIYKQIWQSLSAEVDIARQEQKEAGRVA
jgi:hypothetical protein